MKSMLQKDGVSKEKNAQPLLSLLIIVVKKI